MRRTWATIGIGATATVATTALLSGVASPQGGFVAELVTPPAAATELDAFADCEELRQWYVDAALPHVGPWGLGGEFWPMPISSSVRGAQSAAPGAVAPEARTSDAVANGATGTNVQEAGVDEPDLAKTDGSLLVHVDGRRLVLTDVTGAEPREVSSLRLPDGLEAAELLLVGDRVVVLGTTWQFGGPIAMADVPRTMLPYPGGGSGSTRALVVDVSEPDLPTIEHDATFDGSLVSARQHGDVVRLVVSTTSPAIDFVHPRRGRSPLEAERENERLVRDSTIGDWLPRVETAGSSSSLVGCGDVRHPEETSGFGTVTVVSYDPADPGDRRTTAVTTGSDLVYSSADRLYLAVHQRRASGVHAFALDDLDTTYVASGTVPGHVRDRWSFSEYDGRLRVATAFGLDAWDPSENAVVVLEERGADLVEVGRVGRMGIKEQIQSVRWFGEVAVVVTFRQVDPLYTLDLSDPRAPRVIGELKIPGFSSYLHPLGGDLLLGLGQDATLRGEARGAQAAVFDLSDLADPRRVSTDSFRPWSGFAAAWDPRAFTYLPESRTVLAPMHDGSGRSRLVVMTVAADGGLTRVSDRLVAGWDGYGVRTLPLDGGRVALVAAGEVDLLIP